MGQADSKSFLDYFSSYLGGGETAAADSDGKTASNYSALNDSEDACDSPHLFAMADSSSDGDDDDGTSTDPYEGFICAAQSDNVSTDESTRSAKPRKKSSTFGAQDQNDEFNDVLDRGCLNGEDEDRGYYDGWSRVVLEGPCWWCRVDDALSTLAMLQQSRISASYGKSNEHHSRTLIKLAQTMVSWLRCDIVVVEETKRFPEAGIYSYAGSLEWALHLTTIVRLLRQRSTLDPRQFSEFLDEVLETGLRKMLVSTVTRQSFEERFNLTWVPSEPQNVRGKSETRQEMCSSS